MTRQQRWANRQATKGLCAKCCQPAIGLYCLEHSEQHKVRCRTAYRLKNGIPVNKPIDSNHQPSTITQ